MSKRPTTISRKENATVHNFINTYGYAIIGDTVASTSYAKRLLSNQITTSISIISEGSNKGNFMSSNQESKTLDNYLDQDNNSDIIINSDFAAINNKRILRYLSTEQIHMVPYDENSEEIGNIMNTQTERIIHYHVGSGPLGDFISAYHIPRLGPWFPHTANGRIERFFNEYVVKSSLNSAEIIVVNRLADALQLTSTDSFVVNTPSILNVHYEFLKEPKVVNKSLYHEDNIYTRELFLDQYDIVNQASNTEYITNVSNLTFTPTGMSGLYNIIGTHISLSSVKPIWKTNRYTHLRLATMGGINVDSLYLPTFYRAVLSIPKNGGLELSAENEERIDLSDIVSAEDLVSTHIAFSLHDIDIPKSTDLAWLVQVYTTSEDLSVVHPDGKYADSDKTLLIIEGLSTANKRRTSYNTIDRELCVNYNEKMVEDKYLHQFAQIVGEVYKAYTGDIILVDSLIADTSICSVSAGTCQDASTIVDYALRESPMVSILELASHLYGLDVYHNTSKV